MLIEYEKLAEDYVNGLLTKLRNFSSGADFLEMWVHDEDDAMSLFNMVESAAQYGLKDLSILITRETYEKLKPESFLKTLESLGKAEFRKQGGGMLLEIKFEGSRNAR